MRSTAARGSGAHVLAEVDGDVRLAIALVGGERGARHLAQDALRDRVQSLPLRGALGLGDEEAAHAAFRGARSKRIQNAPFSPTTADTGHMRAM